MTGIRFSYRYEVVPVLPVVRQLRRKSFAALIGSSLHSAEPERCQYSLVPPVPLLLQSDRLRCSARGDRLASPDLHRYYDG